MSDKGCVGVGSSAANGRSVVSVNRKTGRRVVRWALDVFIAGCVAGALYAGYGLLAGGGGEPAPPVAPVQAVVVDQVGSVAL